MSRARRTGVRDIEGIEGGAVAWLYPGGADLDDVLVELLAHLYEEDAIETSDIFVHATEGPHPDPSMGRDWWQHAPPNVLEVVEDLPTSFGRYELEVGFFRRFPWCTCGDDEHAWHIETARQGSPGAMLAVMVSTW